MKKIATAIMLGMASVCTMADVTGNAIDIRTDKIVINTDSLNMPMSTTAYEVLTLLPDLVDRSKDFLFENYSIQINGKTVGDARDAVLSQIRIADIKCIEVSDNSLSTVSSLGQGGSISLELRDATPKLTGSVNADITSEMNYAAGIRLDKKSGKLVFRTVGTVEDYVPRAFHTNSTFNAPYTTKPNAVSEFVSAFIDYHATPVDLFKLTVSEVYTENKKIMEYDDKQYSPKNTDERTRNTNIFAAFNYEHTFPTSGKLCAEINYRYTPEKYNYTSGTYIDSYNHKPHNVYGELKLEQPLFKATANRSAKMELGAQYSYSNANNTSSGINPSKKESANTLEVKETTDYLRPFLKLEAQFNKWQLMGIIDYQHFSYTTDLSSNNNDAVPHRCEDITGQAVAIFQPDKRNKIRLRFERSIKRPSAEQLYPYVFCKPEDERMNYTIGNIDLCTERQNAIDLDYSVNLSTSDYHLELKACAEYTHTFNQINSKPYNEQVTTFVNSGKTDVLLGDLGIYFRKAFFSIWYSGNIYHNVVNADYSNHENHNTYYNLLLRPVFNLNHGWLIALSATYNSPLTTEDSKLGKRFFGTLSVSKTWKHFNAYIYGKQNFVGKQENIIYGENGDDYQWQDYMTSNIGAGIRYSF